VQGTKGEIVVRILTPSDNKRLNEMVGFVGLSLAVLLALSLLSYSPHDASFNVSAAPPGAAPARNWIGPVGAHMSDIFFQFCGFSAFLFPIGMFLVAMRWFRSQLLEAPVTKLVGAGMLLASLSSELALIHMPEVRGALPPGGLLGSVLAQGLRAAFNPLGANLVSIVTFLTALFLTTSFSFRTAGQWMKKPMAEDGYIGGLIARAKEWRESRESDRLRKRVEEIRIAGRPAVAQQRVSTKELAAKEEEEDEEEEPAPKESGRFPTIIKFRDDEPAPAPKKKPAAEPKIALGKTNYKLPPPSLLTMAERGQKMDESELKERARAIEAKCLEFGIGGHITQINPGPVVTTFEFKPEAGIKYSRITGLGDDLCLALQAESILIERIPGKSTVGIEVPNVHRETIALRDVIESPEFSHSPSKLTLPFGKDLIGRIRAGDLTQMPHLLIAGSTGTGKSVFINSLLMGMLFKATPDELKLVLIDPKQVELGMYANIPHLLTPVVTDAKVAANVMRNATREMDRRLKLLAARGVRNIEQYNRSFEKGQSLSLFDGAEEDEHKPLPYLVIIIDELADLMMVDTNGVEESVTRLAQMARAVGIHLILATQRPSVDVITGLIKANFPARVSFRVASKVDSRTILDANGSESLLGKGDMLYLPAGSSRLHRIHGPYVNEREVEAVCDFWKDQAKATFNEELLKPPKDENSAGSSAGDGGEEVDDDLYQDAVRVVCEMGRASTSTLQRRLRVGYGRAARLIDLMEKDGIVGPPDGSKAREVLKTRGWMKEYDDSMK
jgi:S-DNA-T family DNA segregation ATPase FtsK/SpoIIIE